MKIPKNDQMRNYGKTKGYVSGTNTPQYNDAFKKAMETDLGSSYKSINDTMKKYESVNGKDYLFPA